MVHIINKVTREFLLNGIQMYCLLSIVLQTVNLGLRTVQVTCPPLVDTVPETDGLKDELPILPGQTSLEREITSAAENYYVKSAGV